MSDGDAERFADGGWIPGGTVPVVLDVAECIARADDVRAGRLVCSRRDVEHIAAAHPNGGEAKWT